MLRPMKVYINRHVHQNRETNEVYPENWWNADIPDLEPYDSPHWASRSLEGLKELIKEILGKHNFRPQYIRLMPVTELAPVEQEMRL